MKKFFFDAEETTPAQKTTYFECSSEDEAHDFIDKNDFDCSSDDQDFLSEFFDAQSVADAPSSASGQREPMPESSARPLGLVDYDSSLAKTKKKCWGTKLRKTSPVFLCISSV